MTAKRHREVFFAAHGFGPYPCLFCGDDVTFETVNVHHIDEDKKNNSVGNLAPAHTGCHSGHHAKLRQANKTPEQLENYRQGYIKRSKNSEWLRRVRVSTQNPERNQKIGKALSGRTMNEEHRVKLSTATKQRWENGDIDAGALAEARRQALAAKQSELQARLT